MCYSSDYCVPWSVLSFIGFKIFPFKVFYYCFQNSTLVSRSVSEDKIYYIPHFEISKYKIWTRFVFSTSKALFGWSLGQHSGVYWTIKWCCIKVQSWLQGVSFRQLFKDFQLCIETNLSVDAIQHVKLYIGLLDFPFWTWFCGFAVVECLEKWKWHFLCRKVKIWGLVKVKNKLK